MATTGGVSAAAVLAAATKQAHWLINATLEGVTQELANRPAPGMANPIGTAYAHVVCAEDGVVNGLLQGQQPIAASVYAGKTGVDRPMPMPGMVEGDMEDWLHNSHVDLDALRAYSAAVFAATEAFIGGVDEGTLGRKIDMSFAGLGEMPFSDVYTLLVVQHCDNFSGEISAMKGVFGMKGYPF